LHRSKGRNQHAVGLEQEQLSLAVRINIGGALHGAPRKILKGRAVGSIDYDGVPLAVTRVIEKIKNQLQTPIAGDIGHWMRADLRPFRALFDTLLDITAPAHGKALLFGFVW